MKTVCDIDKCNGCMACLEKCPKQCITIDDSVFALNAVIDESKCIKCNFCKKQCPNVSKPDKHTPKKWNQGWANPELRAVATSGGIASELIKHCIACGYLVASCLFDNGQFKFDMTSDYEYAKAFAGSKYVKSNPAGIYEKIKDVLPNNKVLFIGLPCQVAALKKYVSNHENLVTVDLICHGTPSPILLEEFLKEKDYRMSELNDIRFREKTNMGVRIGYKALTYPRVTDDYLLTFLKAITYTENCYHCQFATSDRVGDITLGDSWGSNLKDQEDNGISLILANTEKGIKLLSECDLTLFDVDVKKAIANNHQLNAPSAKNECRDKFIRSYNKYHSFRLATLSAIPKIFIKERVKTILISMHLASPNPKESGGGIE